MLNQSVTVVFFPSSLRPCVSKALRKIQKELQINFNGTLATQEQHTTSGPDVPLPASVHIIPPGPPPRRALKEMNLPCFNILHKLSADITAGKDETP